MRLPEFSRYWKIFRKSSTLEIKFLSAADTEALGDDSFQDFVLSNGDEAPWKQRMDYAKVEVIQKISN